MPTETNLFVLIDAGANTDPTPQQMLQNAVMGSVYSRHVLGYENPRVGLMSIGTEDEKGNDFTRETFELLKTSGLTFRGNVEGHDLFENPVEVVVADGFTGNIAAACPMLPAQIVVHRIRNGACGASLELPHVCALMNQNQPVAGARNQPEGTPSWFHPVLWCHSSCASRRPDVVC